MARKKRPSRLKHWFIPNRNNYYKPAFFSTASVACVLTVLVLLEGAYIASTRTDFFRTNFMASVLPGALVSLANDDASDNYFLPPLPAPAPIDEDCAMRFVTMRDHARLVGRVG